MLKSENIIPGVRVLDVAGEFDGDRVRISSGTKRVESEEYAENSYLNNSPWVAATEDEIHVLTEGASPERGPAEQIAVWKIPSEFASYFSAMRESIKKHNNEIVINNLFEHPNYKRGCYGLFDYCKAIAPHSHFKVLGHYSRVTGLASTSVDKEDKFVGLHIDTWGDASVFNRSGFPSRLCVNLGPEDRYFLFINLSLRQLLALYPDYTYDNANMFVRTFMKDHPNYPVIRLTVRPGEAYIAPTEILIHDATTIGKNYMDCSLTILGDFTLDFLEKIKHAPQEKTFQNKIYTQK